MAISLYRKGDTHEVRGITCEIGTFSHKELEHKLSEGWLKRPEDINSVEVLPFELVEVEAKPKRKKFLGLF